MLEYFTFDKGECIVMRDTPQDVSDDLKDKLLDLSRNCSNKEIQYAIIWLAEESTNEERERE